MFSKSSADGTDIKHFQVLAFHADGLDQSVRSVKLEVAESGAGQVDGEAFIGDCEMTRCRSCRRGSVSWSQQPSFRSDYW